jgi:cytochrome c biogenesis protein CcmG, thiol:disulfide interchange protein DsbE
VLVSRVSVCLRRFVAVRRSLPVVMLLVCSAVLLSQTLVAQSHTDSTVIVGSVVGADGRIPVRADVQLTAIKNSNRFSRARVERDGTFRVAVQGVGPFRLRTAAVGYLGSERALPLVSPTSLAVRVTLAGFVASQSLGTVVGIAAESDADKPQPDMPPAVLLAPTPAGKRVGVLRARRDTVAYRVVDLVNRVYLSPTGAVAYRWAEDGEYDALTVGRAGGKVQLVFDSAAVGYGGKSALRVTDGHPIGAVVAELDSMFALPARKRCKRGDVIPPINLADAVIADTTLSAKLQLIRRFLLADAQCQTHAPLGQAVLSLFVPTSPLWQIDDVMQRRVLLLAARHAAGQREYNTPDAVLAMRERFDASLAAAADTAARFDLYVSAAENFMPFDTVVAQSYAAKFVAESYDHPRVIPLLSLTGYNRVLQPGRIVPSFSVPSMDSAPNKISDVSLRGGVYLLDIWATWCPDCIREFPAMRDLQTKYGARGLQIVSVSVDELRATADRFRRVREPMPWTHAWAGKMPEGTGPLKDFEFTWLPTTILVGKNGRILAFAPKLESPEFAALIEEALR